MEESTDEAGFTLIELMVVLLIMGILMAIAIPTFLGAANGAHDTASQSDLTNSLTSAKSVYATDGSYSSAVTKLKAAEPEMTYGSSTATTANHATHIGVSVLATNNVLVLASYSGTTKHCWLAVDNENATGVSVNGKTAPPGISYGMVKIAATGSCTAGLTVTSWTRSYPKT